MKAEKLDHFEVHLSGCDKCKSVDINSTASLVNCCIIGAPLLRDWISSKKAVEARKVQKSLKRQFLMQADGNVYQGTKAEVKRLTRFK